MPPAALKGPQMRRGADVLESRHTVVSYELDAFGHVNNAVYLNYFEKARNDFLNARGLSFNDFFNWQAFPVLISASLEFISPARAGDRLLILGIASSSSRARFAIKYEIIDENSGGLVCRGETVHVFIDQNSRPLAVPTEFRRRFLEKS